MRVLRLRTALMFVAASGCASTPTYRYAPSPVDVLIQPDVSKPALARAEVAAQGVGEGGGPAGEVLFRVLVESYADAPLELLAEEFRLVDAELRPFGPARVARDESAAGGEGLTIAPHEIGVFEVGFPLGRDDSLPERLVSLVLTWSLRYPEGVASVTSRFERMRRVYYRYDPYYAWDPYWDDPAWGRGHRVYGGATIVIRH